MKTNIMFNPAIWRKLNFLKMEYSNTISKTSLKQFVLVAFFAVFTVFTAGAQSTVNLPQACDDCSSTAVGTIGSLDCDSAGISGMLEEDVAASGVASFIPFTGSNGGTHAGQVVQSTGVTGLTATLAAGNFTVNNPTLIYTISGTPTSAGVALFAINIGGDTCTLSVNVKP